MARQDGEIWVRKPVETLQYHINGMTKTLYPEPFYVALEDTIVNGAVVSLADDEGTAGVVATDSAQQKKASGFARLSAYDPELGPYSITPGVTEIELQTYGQITLPFTRFTRDLTVEDVGEGVFAVTPTQYAWARNTAPLAGALTLSRHEATKYGGNVIECGTVVEVNVGASTAIIDVAIGGDSIGTAGTTQVEYATNQLLATRNTPRVFSYVMNEAAKEHKEMMELHLPAALDLSTLNDNWIALDMFFGYPTGKSTAQKKTLVLYFTTETDGTALNNLAEAVHLNGLGDQNVNAVPQTVPSVNGDGKFRFANVANIAFVNIPVGASARQALANNIVDAAKGAFAGLFDYSGTPDPRLKITVTDNIGGDGAAYSTTDLDSTLAISDDYTLIFETVAPAIGGAEEGGVVYLYYNPTLTEVVTYHDIIRYGALITGPSDFRLVPADRRRYVDAQEQNAPKFINVVGVLASPLPAVTSSTYVYRNERVLLQKMGVVGGFENLVPGSKVYLGYNGHITQNSGGILFDEYLVELGVAKSATEIDFFIADPKLKSTTRDPMPVGVLTPRSYDHTVEPAVPAPVPPGYLALEGQSLNPLDYRDLFKALTGVEATEDSPNLVLQNDPTYMIKAYSFSLFPDTTYPELPVSARRYETSWKILSGDGIELVEGDPAAVTMLNHNMKGSLRDIVAYILISVTGTAGGIGSIAAPLTSAPQMMLYPGFLSDSLDQAYGYQFEEGSMQAVRLRVGPNGLRVLNPATGAFVNVVTASASSVDASATRFVYKVVMYKIEHIYDFKDDNLIQKANHYWYNYRARNYDGAYPAEPALGQEIYRDDIQSFVKWDGSGWVLPAAGAIADGDNTFSGDNNFTGALQKDGSDVVTTDSGTQTIAGIKTFSTQIRVPTSTPTGLGDGAIWIAP